MEAPPPPRQIHPFQMPLEQFLLWVEEEGQWDLWPFLAMQKVPKTTAGFSPLGFVVSKMLWDSDSPEGLGRIRRVYLRDLNDFERNEDDKRISTREALSSLTYDEYDSIPAMYNDGWRIVTDG